jgi:hypothetical protein
LRCLDKDGAAVYAMAGSQVACATAPETRVMIPLPEPTAQEVRGEAQRGREAALRAQCRAAKAGEAASATTTAAVNAISPGLRMKPQPMSAQDRITCDELTRYDVKRSLGSR